MTAITDRSGEASSTAGMDRSEADWWTRQQGRYWDAIARRYDGLYKNEWSRRENAWVRQRLSFIGSMPAPTVVDLGCGTGLGLRMVRELSPFAQYFGVDISEKMVEALAGTDNAAKTRVGSMEDLWFLDDGQTDVVLSLFSSVSYAYDTEAVFREVSRVLAPSGYAYLSMLSSRALSRLRSGLRSGLYRTRGDRQSGTAAPVRRQTVSSVHRLSAAAGLTVEWVTGMNAFSGLAESPGLWASGQYIARKLPNHAHTIEVLLRKPS